MTQFQIASDLHIEHRENIIDPSYYINPSAETLILAGDIGSLYKYDQLKRFITQLCTQFKIVIYVPGNCEYYKNINQTPLSMQELFNRLTKMEKVIDNLYILDRKSVRINDICIIGCTLWSNPQIKIPPYIVRIAGMTTKLYSEKHENDLRYIKKMIKYCQDKQLKLLVITHHSPSFSLFTRKKENYKFISLYATHLDHLLTIKSVNTWISGHTHENFDIINKDGTRLVSNQLGKPKDNVLTFKKNMVIEL
jgi:predicted phosphodiesterase